MDGIPEEIRSPWLRIMRLLDGLSKEELEIRTDSAEVVCGGEGEVKLEAAGQKQDSVDRLASGKVKELVGGKFCCEFSGPIFENRSYGGAVADSETQVKI
jgi:hypothetical protein